MSALEKQRAFDTWASQFLLPLLSGGDAQIGRFLPPSYLDHFAFASPTDNDVRDRIHEELHTLASAVCRRADLAFPDRGSAALLMALQNLAALTDPLLDRTLVRSNRGRVLQWVATLTEAIDPPLTRGAALVRHAVLSQTLASSRVDTVVKNWAYTYRFFGRQPPANVVAMPRLRFVRQEQMQRRLRTLIEEAPTDLETPIARLVARSPVTHILEYGQGIFRFGASDLAVLSDDGLRFGIVQELVQRGTQDAARIFGSALRALSSTSPPPPYLRIALTFAVELQVLEALDEREGTEPTPVPSVSDAELFTGLLPAILELHDAGHPLGSLVALSKRDLDLVRERARRRANEAGDDTVDAAREFWAAAGTSFSSPSDDVMGSGW